MPLNPFIVVRRSDDDSDSSVGFRQPIIMGPPLIDYARRYADFRGLYRVFAPAVYRFYRSNVAPPAVSGLGFFDTSDALPHTPSTTFSDGMWYVAMSYFDGVLDSGFLPVGSQGQTYLTLTISGGEEVSPAPSKPSDPQLVQGGSGVVLVEANYVPAIDGSYAGTQWAIAYTTDGSSPSSGSPTLTPAVSGGAGGKGRAILSTPLPAQANGTVVKVQLQLRRPGQGGVGWVYSSPLPVMTIIAIGAGGGPTAPLGLGTWPGSLPGGST